MSGADEEAVTRAQPLLHPASMAVIGASARPGRPGHAAISAARLYGFTGPLYPVTPRYDEIDGLVCYTDIADVPGPVDLAVIAGAAGRAPGFLEQSIAAGVRGAIIFATLSREKDGGMSPVERVTGMAREAGVPLLGPGSIGYVNYSASLAGTWIPPEPGYAKAGTIALIMQSGSLYAYCGHTDPRLRPCFIAHPGQEADFGTAEILNYALSLPETRVVGLYLETVRDPALFAQCLERADQKNVPIVVFKPGRSARSAQAITTHAGRLAGDDRIFDALFRRYHVARTDTMDEFYATLLMFSKMDVPGPGGLAAVTDSGGQRSVLLDEADRIGLPLAQFSDRTRGRLREVLAPDLPDDNPVDIWGGEENLVEHIEACIEIALDDPDTALTAVFTELGAADGDVFVHSSTSAGINVARVAEKPVLAMTFSSRHFHPNNILKLDDAGLVVLEGVRTGLAAIKHLLDRRERKSGATPDVVGLPYGAPSLVNATFNGGEIEALALLDAAGIEVVDCISAASVQDVREAMTKISGPVALKTAAGHIHKSEVGGVVLSLESVEEALEVYAEMTARLGPEVTVATMAPDGVEVAFGAIAETPFGPAIMFGAGGALVEVLDDVTFELAPIDHTIARDMLARTRVSKLLKGVRGKPACDVDALCDALVRFSHLVAATAAEISEIDVNPVIVSEAGCIAVDAVVRGRPAAND